MHSQAYIYNNGAQEQKNGVTNKQITLIIIQSNDWLQQYEYA